MASDAGGRYTEEKIEMDRRNSMKNIHGGDIYQYNNILDFSANINPLGAPGSVKRAIADAVGEIGHYPEMYSDSLRKAIGEKYHIRLSAAMERRM